MVSEQSRVMAFQNAEYISLRLVRRFLVRDTWLLRIGALVPFYRVNRNQADPLSVADDYARLLQASEYSPVGKRILEVGVGRTNSSAYELTARFAPKSVHAFEPYVGYSMREDAKLLGSIADRHHRSPQSLASQVLRLNTLKSLPDQSIDLVLSSSVLEHVSEPLGLFRELRRVLASSGVMLHIVDYRDHFFKYPYHFLRFRKKTWNRWLNPGDLPVWRIYDHIEQLEAAGFTVRTLEAVRDLPEYAKIAESVSSDYRRGDERITVLAAALWAS
jgi:SAM-dependent methyltransferase